MTARRIRGYPKKSQVSAEIHLLQQLAGHDHALDLVGALVDLGDLGSQVRPLGHVRVW